MRGRGRWPARPGRSGPPRRRRTRGRRGRPARPRRRPLARPSPLAAGARRGWAQSRRPDQPGRSRARGGSLRAGPRGLPGWLDLPLVRFRRRRASGRWAGLPIPRYPRTRPTAPPPVRQVIGRPHGGRRAAERGSPQPLSQLGGTLASPGHRTAAPPPNGPRQPWSRWPLPARRLGAPGPAPGSPVGRGGLRAGSPGAAGWP